MSTFGTTLSSRDPSTGNNEEAPGWLGRYLPAGGLTRPVFFLCLLIVAGFKVITIAHYRADTDETQHAHVAWGWANGYLQYRDVFDNHMPLFQMLMAPLMKVLGERADIMIPLRYAMVPLYLVCVWAVFRLTVVLYSERAAPWVALSAAAYPNFFYTSTEFRTDDLWAAFWLLTLVVAVSGKYSIKRAFWMGIMLGLAFAASQKTVLLMAGLAVSAGIAWGVGWRNGAKLETGWVVARLGAAGLGTLIMPAAVVGYFVYRHAFWIMYYCVILHNIVPRLKRWGHLGVELWYFPLSVVVLWLYGEAIFRQCPDKWKALRRTLIAIAPWFILSLLWSYWPDITREDDLVYAPLLPLSLVPLISMVTFSLHAERGRAVLWRYVLPIVLLTECVSLVVSHSIKKDRLERTTRHIADVLAITKPGDYVMDEKGEYVFRPRAYYWAIETVTKTRLKNGSIRDNLAERLREKGPKVCYLYCAHNGSIAAHYILDTYLPVDPTSTEIGVLGKVIGWSPGDNDFTFSVNVPQEYVVFCENGDTAGELDGKRYTGPIWITAGKHEFQRTGGTGRVAILLNGAYEKGFRPLIDADAAIIADYGKLPPERGNLGPDLQ